jgi:hypothetical protein
MRRSLRILQTRFSAAYVLRNHVHSIGALRGLSRVPNIAWRMRTDGHTDRIPTKNSLSRNADNLQIVSKNILIAYFNNTTLYRKYEIGSDGRINMVGHSRKAKKEENWPKQNDVTANCYHI